jgi:hypothetical protein
LALADWSVELSILEDEKRRQTGIRRRQLTGLDAGQVLME